MKTKPPKRSKTTKVNTVINSNVKSENFSLFFSGSIIGLVILKLYVTHYIATVHFTTYLDIYVLGWLVSVSSGMAAVVILKFIREKWFAEESCFYSAMGLVNFAFMLYAYQPNHWGDKGLPVPFLWIQPIGLAAAKALDKKSSSAFRANAFYFIMISLAFVWFSNLVPDWWSFKDWHFYNYLFFAVILILFFGGFRRTPERAGLPLSFSSILGIDGKMDILRYFAAFVMIAFSINTLFNYDPFHYSFFLGPVADLSGGKSLLFNINSQYGILVIYFLRFFFLFLPIGYVSFSFILALLTLIQYLLVYFISRKLFQSEAMAFFSLVVVLLINHFAQFNNGILFPSVGPLRFGFIYVFMFLILLRNEFPAQKKLFLLLESLLVGAAFFWSFEVCVYIVVSYGCFLLYDCVDFSKGVKFDYSYFLKRVLALAGSVLGVAGFIYLDVFRRVHEWPHWNYYLDFVFSYKNGFGMLELPGMGYWWAMVAVFFFSLFAIAGISLSKIKNFPPHLNAMVFLAFYGILHFIYYFSRAHLNNLFHLSVPGILLVLYWLHLIRWFKFPSMPTAVKTMAYGSTVVLLGIYLQKTTDFAVEKIKVQPQSPSVIVGRLLALPSVVRDVDPSYLRIEQLMKKYSGDTKALVYFLGESGVNFSMGTGRINLYPYNDIIQPTVSSRAMDRILSFDPPLKPGDYIYSAPLPADSMEKKLFDRIASRFNLETAEQASGITVYKVTGIKKPS